MSHKKTLVSLCLFLALGLILTASQSWADYPEKPIKLIVSFSAGGGSDLTARTLVPFWEKELGGKIVVINKPGSSGEVGHTAVAMAKPDGYTLGLCNLPPMVTLPIERPTKFTLDSFDLIGNLVADPSGLSVSIDSPFKSVADVVAYAKKNPNVLTFGFTGIGTDDHLWVVMFAKAAGIQITPVPFAGSSRIRTALMGGHVSVACVNMGEMMPFQGKKVRILAQMGKKRSPLAPDIPTMAEQGYQVFMRSERGIVAPKGIPAPVLKKLRATLAKAVANPKYHEKVKQQYFQVAYMDAKEMAEHLKELDQTYRALWKENPWKK